MFCHIFPVACLSLLIQDEIHTTLAKEAPHVFDGSLTKVIWKIEKFFQINDLVSLTFSPGARL